jgi:hypothetical protein
VVELFKFRFFDNNTKIKHKPVSNSVFLTMKQKRYKRRKNVPLRVKFEKLPGGGNTKNVR